MSKHFLNIFFLCSTEEYRFGMTRSGVNYDNFFFLLNHPCKIHLLKLCISVSRLFIWKCAIVHHKRLHATNAVHNYEDSGKKEKIFNKPSPVCCGSQHWLWFSALAEPPAPHPPALLVFHPSPPWFLYHLHLSPQTMISLYQQEDCCLLLSRSRGRVCALRHGY